MTESNTTMVVSKEITDPDKYKELIDVYSQEDEPAAEEVTIPDPDDFYNHGEQIIKP